MINNKKIATSLSNPLWKISPPSISEVQNDISKWVDSFNSSEYLLSVISFENAAHVLCSYGEDFSNQCMGNIISSIKQTFGDELKIIRLSIDLLILVCPFENKDKFTDLVNKAFILLNASSKPSVYLTIQCGVSRFNKQTLFSDSFKQALVAQYESRMQGKNSVCFFENVSELVAEYQNEMKMAAYFQNVLLNKRCKLAFQPIINSKTGEVKSYEALLRVITEEEQIVSAGPFINVAEKFAFVDQVDILTLEMIVRELQLAPQVHISVNISTYTISNNKWIKIAKDLLKDPKVASRLTIEITETGIHQNLNNTIEFVDFLQSIGCTVAIDDFGAGYTSFTQLKLLNADIIKIDGLFVRDITENHDSKLFVKTLLEFAKAFCLQTTAEFVETGEIAKILMTLGVDYMQGYYFGKPLNYRPWIKDDRNV